jgi:hypothetical protein
MRRPHRCYLLALLAIPGVMLLYRGGAEGVDPALLDKNICKLSQGADNILLSKMPGDYVSYRIQGEACDGFYIPGQGAVLRLWVSFPLVPPASCAPVVPMESCTPEVRTSTPSVLPHPDSSSLTERKRTKYKSGGDPVEIFQRRIEQQNRLMNRHMSRLLHANINDPIYDQVRCEKLQQVIVHILARYAGLLEDVPDRETISVVVSGPVALYRLRVHDATTEVASASPGTRLDALSSNVLTAKSTKGKRVHYAQRRPRLYPTRYAYSAQNRDRRSTMVLMVPAGKISSDPMNIRENITVVTY